MDSLDLLAREDEFKKLNKQLEKKTESLVKEIEHVMQKQDFFSEFSHSLTLSPYHNTTNRKHCCGSGTPKSSEHSTPTKTLPKINKKTASAVKKKTNVKETESVTNSDYVDLNKTEKVNCDCCKADERKGRIDGDLEFLYAFVSVSVQEKVLPASFLKERATVESVCKFLSSKVKLMQEQIDRLQSTINKKAAQCEVHLTRQAELEGERMTLLNRSNNLQAAVSDVRTKNAALTKRLEEKDRLHQEQRSEADKLSSEVKRLKLKCTGAEARAASLEDTIDSLRHQLDTAKVAEKELRATARTLSASQKATTSQLEAKIKTLNTRIYRQQQLIDNLKQQRSLLAAEGAVKILESEYKAFLNADF